MARQRFPRTRSQAHSVLPLLVLAYALFFYSKKNTRKTPIKQLKQKIVDKFFMAEVWGNLHVAQQEDKQSINLPA